MEGRITIKLVENREIFVDAHVFGDWAAHPGVDVDSEPRLDWWVVTHVPNGRRIRSPGQMTKNEAIGLAQALDLRGATLPVYQGATEVPDLAELSAVDPAFTAAAKMVKSVVFDALGRIEFD